MVGKSNTLAAYRKKRDRKRTPEPFAAGQSSGELVFVVQAHNARRMHYDLRLESEGALVSFAIPRGIPERPSEKHLAVHTEDHPLSYADFEGFIPKGEYGAGDMIIWDRGTYIPLIEPRRGLEDGKLLFELRGQRARGLYTLVRTKGERQWLLMKKPDGWQGAHHDDAVPAILAEAKSAPRGALRVKEVELMLASTAKKPFSDPDWLFELKYDGYRVLGGKHAGGVELRYRRGLEVGARFPEIVAALRALPAQSFVIDGELVALRPDGTTDFHALEQQVHLPTASGLTLIAFDLLALEGRDLRGFSLERRKRWLQMLLRASDGTLRFAAHVAEEGAKLYTSAIARGAEGIVAKRRDAPYTGGRSEAWKKVRAHQNGEFVVVGYGKPDRGRAGFSSLLLADPETRTYVGRVGTGFDVAGLVRMRKALDRIVRRTPLCQVPAVERKDAVWVEPEVLVQVRYSAFTREGHLRQPVFERLRDDKVSRPVTVSNRDKIFFPELGLKKGDLVDYYRAIAPHALPYYRGRPAMLARFPDGIYGKSFFQKDAPDGAPPWLRTMRAYSDGTQREIDHFVLESEEALAYVANLGTIPIHVWSSCVETLERPDYTVIDLDPKTAPFSDVVTLALAVRELCEAIALPSFVKTTGSSGLHVMIPLHRRCSYAQSRLFAELISRVVAARHPQIATLEREPKKRKGRVYLDCLQNGHGKTIAGPYCVRPVPEAAVSMPLAWSEVGKKLTPRGYTLRNALRAADKRKIDPLAGVLSETPDLVAALERLQVLEHRAG